MTQTGSVLEYKCPSCGACLVFGSENQQMTCEYCDSTFDIKTVIDWNESQPQKEPAKQIKWESQTSDEFSQEEYSSMQSFICNSCGGELTTDGNTAATFCPYCGNPTILPGRVSQQLKPDGVLPFRKTKEDAKAAFLNLCKGKPLLPKFFKEDHRVEKITGIYVPFWLYDCNANFQGRYKATRVRHWSDANYNYTKTEHFMLQRASSAAFSAIPMDASQKMDDSIMESIEPFDYSQMVDFRTAYLSGYFADKYDVEAKAGEERIYQRVGNSMDDMLQGTFIGYSSVVPTVKQLNVDHSKAKYVLLPVWMLYTKYKDKSYVFAMNGQTGKMTGTFPICPKRTASWFCGIMAGIAAVSMLIQYLAF